MRTFLDVLGFAGAPAAASTGTRGATRAERCIAPGETVRLELTTTTVSPRSVFISITARADGTTELKADRRRGIAVEIGDRSRKNTFLSSTGSVVVPISDPLNQTIYVAVTCENGVPSRDYPGSKPSQDVEFWNTLTSVPLSVTTEGGKRVFRPQ